MLVLLDFVSFCAVLFGGMLVCLLSICLAEASGTEQHDSLQECQSVPASGETSLASTPAGPISKNNTFPRTVQSRACKAHISLYENRTFSRRAAIIRRMSRAISRDKSEFSRRVFPMNGDFSPDEFEGNTLVVATSLLQSCCFLVCLS